MRKTIWQISLLVGLLVIVVVLTASRPGTTLEGAVISREVDMMATPTGEPLRVLTLNVLHGFPRFANLKTRFELIASGLQELQPDVVCLQEVPWTRRLGNGAAYLAQQAGYQYLYIRANGNRRTIFFEEGEAILSRYPLRDPTFVELRPRAGFFQHRMALRAVIEAPVGDVAVVATHLTHSDHVINAAQAAALQAFVAGGVGEPGAKPVLGTVICGDFNAQEDSPQIQSLAAVWIDAYRAAHPDAPGLTCCAEDDQLAGPAARDAAFARRIDYIFLSPAAPAALTVGDAWTVFDAPVPVGNSWQWPSDHGGVFAELVAQP